MVVTTTQWHFAP